MDQHIRVDYADLQIPGFAMRFGTIDYFFPTEEESVYTVPPGYTLLRNGEVPEPMATQLRQIAARRLLQQRGGML